MLYTKPAHLAQNDQPWSRLNDSATLNSLRRNVLYYDEEAPRDSLDLHLKAMYDQHVEFLKNKKQTLYQRETLTEDHGRILKNRVRAEPPEDDGDRERMKVSSSSQKSSIHSIECAIESHHNASTNRGYSRKHDGGFYST
ncbi:protein CFAP276-like [Conger conger]|nr:protein CFAP276-like [Conger conger]